MNASWNVVSYWFWTHHRTPARLNRYSCIVIGKNSARLSVQAARLAPSIRPQTKVGGGIPKGHRVGVQTVVPDNHLSHRSPLSL